MIPTFILPPLKYSGASSAETCRCCQSFRIGPLALNGTGTGDQPRRM